MELWGNDLAGGILLQEPYQTKAYQQEIKPPQATPNRFVNLTYLSPSKQIPSIGLQYLFVLIFGSISVLFSQEK